MSYHFLDLFSGIGGFALGAEWAGVPIDQHFFSEVDDFAVRVYEKQFPNANNLGDIRQIRAANLPNGKWIVCGGFPCQDISTAGKQRGINAERSGLWWEMLRVIRELQPEIVVAENVKALTSCGLDRVVCSLSKSGYDCEWEVLRASQFNLPHRRERVFIVAYPHENGCRTFGQVPTLQRDLGEVWETDNKASAPSTQLDWKRTIARREMDSEPLVNRTDDGLSRQLDKHRVAALGNAVIPQITCEIFRRIIG